MQASKYLILPLNQIRTLGINLIAPIFKIATEEFEKILLCVHLELKEKENELFNDKPIIETSLYMKKFNSQLKKFENEYLKNFSSKPCSDIETFSGILQQRLAKRLIIFFIRQTSLIRNLGTKGRYQIVYDATVLLRTITQNLIPITRLSLLSQALNAYKKMLSLENSEVETILSTNFSITLHIPKFLILHHLFSRLPEEMKSPYERSNLSPMQYSLWLDEHGDKEATENIIAVLETIKLENYFNDCDKNIIKVMKNLCNLCDIEPTFNT